jgi:hypothetical protein
LSIKNTREKMVPSTAAVTEVNYDAPPLLDFEVDAMLSNTQLQRPARPSSTVVVAVCFLLREGGKRRDSTSVASCYEVTEDLLFTFAFARSKVSALTYELGMAI